MKQTHRLVRTAGAVAAALTLVVALPFVASAIDGDSPPPAAEAPETIWVMDAKSLEPVEYAPEEIDRLRAEGWERFGEDASLQLYGGEYLPIPGAPELVCVETETDKVCGDTQELVDATLAEMGKGQPEG